MPDGCLLISSKPGTMQIVKTDGKIDKTITGFPSVQFAGQGPGADIGQRSMNPIFASRVYLQLYPVPHQRGCQVF